MNDRDAFPQRPVDLTVETVRALLLDDRVTHVDVERVGEGFGLESVVARVDAGTPEGVRSLAVKFCTSEAARAEAHTHSVVLAPTRVPRPSLIASHDDGEHGLLVFDFVEGEQGDVLKGCAPHTALDIVESIAELHASWWGTRSSSVPPLTPRLRRPLTHEQIDACVADHSDVLAAPAQDVIRSLPARIDELVDALEAHPMTIAHTDLHLDNVIVDASGRATILDWGRPRRGAAAVDIARCFVEVVGVRPDDELGRELTSRYLTRLQILGVAGYTEDQLRAAIRSSHLLFVPGVVRWAAAARAPQGSRAWQLLRNALARVGGLIT